MHRHTAASATKPHVYTSIILDDTGIGDPRHSSPSTMITKWYQDADYTEKVKRGEVTVHWQVGRREEVLLAQSPARHWGREPPEGPPPTASLTFTRQPTATRDVGVVQSLVFNWTP